MADCKVSLGAGGTPLFIQFAPQGSRFKWSLSLRVSNALGLRRPDARLRFPQTEELLRASECACDGTFTAYVSPWSGYLIGLFQNNASRTPVNHELIAKSQARNRGRTANRVACQ